MIIINILIRTSWRPEAFGRCLQSIFEQIPTDVVDFNIIVGYDNPEALQYIPPSIRSMYVQYTGDSEYGYNTYLNSMMRSEFVHKPGYIIFLDDDDTLIQGAFIKLGASLMPDRSCIFPFVRPNGFMKPMARMVLLKHIVRGYIGMPCLVLNTDHIPLVEFDDTADADYNAILKLSSQVDLDWYLSPLVSASDRSRGRMENKF